MHRSYTSRLDMEAAKSVMTSVPGGSIHMNVHVSKNGSVREFEQSTVTRS